MTQLVASSHDDVNRVSSRLCCENIFQEKYFLLQDDDDGDDEDDDDKRMIFCQKSVYLTLLILDKISILGSQASSR